MADKKMGFGLMRLPVLDENDQSTIDIEQTCKMVDSFIEKGFTYFDTALMYMGDSCESAVKTVLTSRYPRDKYTLATKMHAAYVKTAEDLDRVFAEQLSRTGVEYFDYYLIHYVGRTTYKKYNRLDTFNWLKEKKAQGLVKKIGFSYHDSAEFLETVLSENPGMDFVQLQINYLDWDSEGVQSRLCYQVAVDHNLPVVVMEPVKGGTLSKLSPQAETVLKERHPDLSITSWAMRFCASLENVFMVLSGSSNIEQMEDNLSYMSDFKPFDADEFDRVKKVAEIINSDVHIPCTGCGYCLGPCPQEIPIPKYFSLYNADRKEVSGNDWTPQMGYYDNTVKVRTPAGQCIKCGKCEEACPQHLPVIKHLEEVAEYFGR
ncbi:MAG: aldo/keto reductase [Oscillospiraceae bacterium]|nr:aldo/keto reductase [Oscillospiraceae bacterium]